MLHYVKIYWNTAIATIIPDQISSQSLDNEKPNYVPIIFDESNLENFKTLTPSKQFKCVYKELFSFTNSLNHTLQNSLLDDKNHIHILNLIIPIILLCCSPVQLCICIKHII